MRGLGAFLLMHGPLDCAGWLRLSDEFAGLREREAQFLKESGSAGVGLGLPDHATFVFQQPTNASLGIGDELASLANFSEVAAGFGIPIDIGMPAGGLFPHRVVDGSQIEPGSCGEAEQGERIRGRHLSGGEAFAAGTMSFRVGVGHFEPPFLQVIGVIEFGTADEKRTFGIDHDADIV